MAVRVRRLRHDSLPSVGGLSRREEKRRAEKSREQNREEKSREEKSREEKRREEKSIPSLGFSLAAKLNNDQSTNQPFLDSRR